MELVSDADPLLLSEMVPYAVVYQATVHTIRLPV